MKKSKYPRLRSKTYKGAGGQVWTYFLYDMRGTGKPDVRLGKDYDLAIAGWHKLHTCTPMTVGRIQEAIDKWREDVLPTYSTNTRDQYRCYLKDIEVAFGKMAWHEVRLQTLIQYVSTRSKKTSANREMAVLAVVWKKAQAWDMVDKPWPALGLPGKDWKNKEQARVVEVTDAMFDALHAEGDRVVRDALDIQTATGMRLTDIRTIRLPVNGVLRFKASKTGKWAEFNLSQSPVLSALVERRLAMQVHSVLLLVTDTGRQVSDKMLYARWCAAKKKAIEANPSIADQLEGLYNRDMRKRAADLADDMAGASKLLQHSSEKITASHYRTKPEKLKAVR